jgi:hypothetical protein
MSNNMTESNRRNLFLVLCAVALLNTGADITQSFVNYPTWHLIDAGSFPAYHRDLTIRAVVFLLVPRVVEIMIGLIVLRFRPKSVERWVVVLGIGLTLAAFLSTALIQYPIHSQLEIQGNTPELLSRLMATDWIRNLPEFARSALYVWALSRVVNFSEHSERAVAPT